MQAHTKYKFSAKIWKHQSAGGWQFVTIPTDLSSEIRTLLQWQEEGWGRMKAIASIEDVQWKTSIWFDTKSGNYVLPIKAQIRKSLSLEENDLLTISVYL